MERHPNETHSVILYFSARSWTMGVAFCTPSEPNPRLWGGSAGVLSPYYLFIFSSLETPPPHSVTIELYGCVKGIPSSKHVNKPRESFWAWPTKWNIQYALIPQSVWQTDDNILHDDYDDDDGDPTPTIRVGGNFPSEYFLFNHHPGSVCCHTKLKPAACRKHKTD